MKVELDLSSYATKADWKRLTGADTSKPAAKTELASLKAPIDWFEYKHYGDWKQDT